MFSVWVWGSKNIFKNKVATELMDAISDFPEFNTKEPEKNLLT